MGFVGALMSGAGGSYSAQGVPLQQSVTKKQTNTAYDQTQSGLTQQQNFANQTAAQNGLQHQQDVYGQLQGVAAGTGPNPAQMMLNQATGQNVANQAALMASQRGAGANPALLARLAAQQGANVQQQAVGQGAALGAQQQLAAMGQMGNLANTQVGQQQNALNAYNQYAQNQQQNLLNAVANYNQAQVGMQSNINNNNTEINKLGMQAGAGLLGAAGQGVSMFGGGGGGSQTMAGGPNAANLASMATMFASQGGMAKGPMSFAGKHICMSEGGQVPAMVSPGEEIYHTGSGSLEKVPGQAKVKGDSLKNDTVPMMLNEGDVVVPRTSAKDNGKAAKFIQACLAKNGMRLK